MTRDGSTEGLARRAAGGLKKFVLIELRIVLSVWPMLLLAMAIVLGLAAYFPEELSWSFPYVAIPVAVVAGWLLSKLADWLEAHTSWYNRIVYTGEINK